VGGAELGAVLAVLAAVVPGAVDALAELDEPAPVVVAAGAPVVAVVATVVTAPLEELSPPQAAVTPSATTGTTRRRHGVLMLGDAMAALRSSQVGHWRRSLMRQQVEETIEVIRPALQADGGDIFLRDVDEATGVVTVTLLGACGTCPVSTDTLKAGIERIMRDRVDGVTEVVAV
jgi:Fe-S cluster biogenesis protein NfuA